MPIIGGSSGAGPSSPGYEIGYDQITSPVNVVGTTESAGTTIITCAAHNFDGSPVLVTFFTPFIEQSSNAGGQVTVCLFESSTQITRLITDGTPATAVQNVVSMVGLYRFTPTNGSHTYTVTAFSPSTTGTPQIGAGAGGTAAYPPCFIRFTKV